MQKLEDHIDEPIKKCVVGMSLLGFEPMMSCCGFSYKGEKVPKEHLKKAYIYLYFPHLRGNALLCRLLLELSVTSRWNISPVSQHIIDFYANHWDQNHPWNKIGCPHNHEIFVLWIDSLEKAIEKYSSCFLDQAIINDGNNFYKDELKLKHWQYEPTENWIVTPETWNSL